MIKIKINTQEFLVKADISVLEACKYVGIDVPRFCYHEMLSVSGNCRMCLVEIEKSPKPVAACALPVMNNMQIFVDTPLVKKARENVLETLLLNHPLDCPICDQGGECDLQDQTKLFGGDFSRFFFNKRGVEDKECGPLIKTIMTRCIHCTRCVRFGSEIAGVDFLGTLNRGTSTEIGSYVSSIFNSEISGNVIDLCPVGALTSKPYAFRARPWEIKSTESIDLMDSTGSNIYVNFKESEIIRILPKNRTEINENIISDKARFSYDSLKNQRLQKIFQKVTNEDKTMFKVTNWHEIFKQIDNLLYANKSIVFLVNDELDLHTYNLLRLLSNTFKNNIKIKSINLINQSNYKNNTENDTILNLRKASKFCFLISANLRLESAIINTKIRMKYMDQNISIFGLGQFFNSTFPVEFLGLNPNHLVKLLEAKNSTLSKALISFKNPIILFGNSLNKRITNITILTHFFKKIIPSCIILNLKNACNSSGLEIFNTKGISSSDLVKSDAIIALNLDDNIYIRKQLEKSKKLLFWFNTNSSKLATKATFLIPAANFFEEEGIFINLENRPQKSLKVLSVIHDTRSTYSIIKALSTNKDINSNNLKNSKFLSYVDELVETSSIFSKLNKKFLKSSKIQVLEKTSKSLISCYPFKPTVDNYYTTNKFTKNSLIMNQCAKDILKIVHNF